MDYKKEALTLVQNLNQRMGPSSYDIAWLARLQARPQSEPLWPDLIEWLLENQHPDGSWGGQVIYYHDRIICTLAAAIALCKNGHSPRATEALNRAEHYLWHHLHFLPRDPFELVGFELIFPTLLIAAQSAGVDVPIHTCGYGAIQTAKLRLIPPEMLYSPKISTVHSLEFLGQSADLNKLQQALAPNGSLGNSPAATAYYLLLKGEDEHAMAYLETTRHQLAHIIYLYPFRIFELSWVLNNLAFCGAPITEFTCPALWEELRSEMGPTGIGLDPTFGIPDGDITSVCSRLLISAGYDVDPLILHNFEDKHEHIFRTYDYERNVSVGTNVHALEVLRLMPDYPNRREVQEQIILMLLSKRVFDVYWIDKWHASPYYATAHVFFSLLQGDFYLPYFCHPTADWLLHTQHPDGSWGFFQQGTAEETAYALTALLQYNRYKRVDQEALHRGAAYLEAHYQGAAEANYPELWIGKCLYVPYEVVRSAILAALILYKETFGHSP